jgi:hypothetical protein
VAIGVVVLDSRERQSPFDVLEVAARWTAWAGGRVVLFWPAEEESGRFTLGLFVPDAAQAWPTERIARELGAEVAFEEWGTTGTEGLTPSDPPESWRDALELWRSLILSDDPGGLRHSAGIQVFPWPGGRCPGCGAERPPHLDGCPLAFTP